MPTYSNTGLAQSLAPFYGSCKVELSEDAGATWVNVGLARGVNFNEQMESTDIMADNGPNIARYVSTHKVEITMQALEFYLPTLHKLRGGIDLLSVTSAVATTRTDSFAASAWAYDQNLLLTNQGASSTKPTITAVKTWKTGSTTALTTSGKDFVKTLDQSGKVGITVLSTGFGGDAKDTEALRVTYNYGAIQNRKLTSGGLSTITSKWFRLTNKQIVSSVAKYRYLTLYSASLNAGLNLAFKSSNDADPILEIPISMVAILDATRTAGDQLFAIEDSVAVA
jgi:hypothetical protein